MPVVLVGRKEADRAISRLPGYVKGEVQIAATQTAVVIAAHATQLAPRSHDGEHGHPPGFLASQIAWAASKGISAVVGVHRAAFYWKFLEYGWSEDGKVHAARPFFRPAADEERPRHLKRVIDALIRSKNRMLSNG